MITKSLASLAFVSVLALGVTAASAAFVTNDKNRTIASTPETATPAAQATPAPAEKSVEPKAPEAKPYSFSGTQQPARLNDKNRRI
jgi:hypothetical protein